MALSITVNGAGTFTASMEEGPVSFTASLGAVGPQGPTGATGPTGVVAAAAPITYDSGTQTVGISPTPTFTSVTVNDGGDTALIEPGQALFYGLSSQMLINELGLTFPDNTEQTTAFVGEARKVYIIGRNNTGTTIAKGKVVRLSGATGNKPTIALAQADTEGNSARTIGITVEAIADNADGKVIVSGAAENIDTSAFNAGDTVHLSAATAGGLVTALPTQPLHGVVVGIVTRANPTVGSIEVAINNYQELEELSDVLVSSKANLDLLAWDSASGTWQNKTFATLGLLTSATAASTYLAKASNLSDLANAGTARTNLGLGTMAVETAANYALLASPTFSGTPSLPTGTIAVTQAAGNNTTAVATTAFVQTSNPAASETVAGHVELATDAEAIAGSNTTTAMTPADVRRHLLSHRYRPIPIIGWTTAASGTGAAASQSVFFPRVTGANAGVAGNARLTALIGNPSRGRASSVFNWSKAVACTARIIKGNITDTAHTLIFSFGKNLTWPGYGDLTAKGIAAKIVGSTISLQVHDGTNLTSVTASVSLTVNESTDLLLLSDGAGNVDLYVNDSVVATTSAGPTGNSPSNSFVLAYEVDSTSSSTVQLADNFIGCVSFWHDC